jgi:hypothetical protein
VAGSEIWFERRKHPATPHYGHPAWVIGEDELGVWCDVRAGSKWFRGETFLFDGPFDALVLVPNDGGYIAWFWPAGGELDLCVDIVTNIERTDESITAVDLDLDVIRFRADGRVQLVDEDEFAEPQVSLGYSAEIIDHASRTAAWVVDAVRAGESPFDGKAAARWRATISR